MKFVVLVEKKIEVLRGQNQINLTHLVTILTFKVSDNTKDSMRSSR
jgi:hypothetical protein